MIKFLWFELNLEEIFIGSCIQFPLYYFIGWWVLLLMPLCGLLWAMGGSKEGIKLIRRLGVPLVCAVAIYLCLGLYWPLLIASAVTLAVISQGYGENSVIYKLWDRLCPVPTLRDFAVRTTIYIMYFLTYVIAVPFCGRF